MMVYHVRGLVYHFKRAVLCICRTEVFKMLVGLPHAGQPLCLHTLMSFLAFENHYSGTYLPAFPPR